MYIYVNIITDESEPDRSNKGRGPFKNATPP